MNAGSASATDERPTSVASPTNLNATWSDSNKHPAETPNTKERSRGSKKKDGSSCGGAARTLTWMFFFFLTSSSVRQQKNRCSAVFFFYAQQKHSPRHGAREQPRRALCGRCDGEPLRLAATPTSGREEGEGFSAWPRVGPWLASWRFVGKARAIVSTRKKV